MHGSTAFLELNDPMRFNTFSADLGEDTRVAVQHLNSMPGLSSLVMQGSGPHFSVGGNPYALQQTSRTPFACFAQSLRELYHGFIQLRMLPCTTLGAVHGTLVGGGIAGCLHTDYLVADRMTHFEHGNLVRGVCVLGMLSQTFGLALGLHSRHVYLQNARLNAISALATGLVNSVCAGVQTTQLHAWQAAQDVAFALRTSCDVSDRRAAIEETQ